MKVKNWYINSNKALNKKSVEKWTTEMELKPEDEITRLKAIIENLLGCHNCAEDPHNCDYDHCASVGRFTK